MSATKISANLTMIGDHAIITTFIDMVSINPVVEGAIKLYGQSAAWTLDWMIGRKLLWTRVSTSGTYEVSATNGHVGARNLLSGVATASAATAGMATVWNAPMYIIDDMTTRNVAFSSMGGGLSGTIWTPSVLRKIKLKLKVKNSLPFDDGYYRAIMHPDVVNQLRGSSAYIDLHKYTESGVKTFESGNLGAGSSVRSENGLAGIMEGFKIYETPEAPYCTVTTTAISCNGAGYYYFSFFFAKGAYGVTDFDGGIHTYVKVPGPQSTDNPLDLYSKVGYRFIFAAKVLNPSACLWVASGKPLEQG